MPSTTIRMRNIAGTEAAMGWAGSHTIVADRPEGKAGGGGLGFNGAELLGLTIGGCICNDLRYVAHRRGVEIEAIAVDVTVELDGDPIIATAAQLSVRCTMKDGSDSSSIIDEVKAACMAINSLAKGVPVAVSISS